MFLAADAAYPFDLHQLPLGVKVILGYLGGATPNVWTLDEITTVRDSSRPWWGIWTMPQHAVDDEDGHIAATGTVKRLRELNYPKTDPVFLDVEYSTWAADPDGALAAITHWKNDLTINGYRRTFAYVPLVAGFDWIAHWTGSKPNNVPTDCVGVQYASDIMLGKPFDLSVFNDGLLHTVPGHDPLPQDPTEQEDDMKPFSVRDGNDDHWIIAADLSARVQVSEAAAKALGNTGQYLPNPGIDQTTLIHIPDVTVRDH